MDAQQEQRRRKRPPDPVAEAHARGRLEAIETATLPERPEVRPLQASGPPEADTRPADDLLDGGQAIADYLGVPLRKVYRLFETGRMPIGRLGRRLIASKRRLDAAIKKVTRGTTAA